MSENARLENAGTEKVRGLALELYATRIVPLRGYIIEAAVSITKAHTL